QGDDAANNTRLLAELNPLPDDRREAYYVCFAVLCDPAGAVRATSEGRCHGIIARDHRGTGGFGYDPLFLIPEFGRSIPAPPGRCLPPEPTAPAPSPRRLPSVARWPRRWCRF